MNPDSFDLDGKNLNRVAPQIRRQIALQRSRMVSYVVGAVLLACIGALWLLTDWIPAVVAIPCVALIPFALFGVFADHRLLKFQQRRLAECECRLVATVTTT